MLTHVTSQSLPSTFSRVGVRQAQAGAGGGGQRTRLPSAFVIEAMETETSSIAPMGYKRSVRPTASGEDYASCSVARGRTFLHKSEHLINSSTCPLPKSISLAFKYNTLFCRMAFRQCWFISTRPLILARHFMLVLAAVVSLLSLLLCVPYSESTGHQPTPHCPSQTRETLPTKRFPQSRQDTNEPNWIA